VEGKVRCHKGANFSVENGTLGRDKYILAQTRLRIAGLENQGRHRVGTHSFSEFDEHRGAFAAPLPPS
jgi:hypothetical protein